MQTETKIIEGPVEPLDASFSTMEVEAIRTPVAVLIHERVSVDDPLPVESHPYRPSIDLSVAVLCVEVHDGVPCNMIYAKESQGSKAEERCPRCGSAAAFEVRRVIR